jgi:Phosphopantetheinyl transferase
MRTKIYLASVKPLEEEARFERLLRTVQAARREKLALLKNAGARRLSLGAGLLLNAALAAEGLRAEETATTEYGKPFFPALPDFHFSLSHSGEMVMCAVSSAPVGCDLEKKRCFDPRLARRFFHPSESAWLFSLPDGDQRTAFFRLWTCKESYMKAVGLGFALPMNEFAVSVGEEITLTRTADPRPWKLRSFWEGDYACAVCGLSDIGDAAPIHVDFDGG